MEENNEGRAPEEIEAAEEELLSRRDFLFGLKKWSKIVIVAALVGKGLLDAAGTQEAQAGVWGNRGGGGAWANRAIGGGAWANRGGGGGAWANRAIGGGAWANRGGTWVNRF